MRRIARLVTAYAGAALDVLLLGGPDALSREAGVVRRHRPHPGRPPHVRWTPEAGG